MFRSGLAPGRGRLLVAAAAVLWSLGGPLAKLADLPGPTMACLRALFAGLVLLPLVRPRAVRFRPAMIGMVACFAAMNACYVTSITLTTAANAIFLQYTAPAWMFLASALWLGEPLDRRSLTSLVVGMIGIAVIVLGNWREATVGVVLALVAGVTYGGVAVFLRVLRDEDAVWLTVLNHLVGGLALLPVLFTHDEWQPIGLSAASWAAMVVFGVVQMGVPYILFSRGLSVITPQEAGIIALIEPALNPVLTYFAVGEQPSATSIVGGGVILGAVVLRYRGRPPSG
jgi:drug/metabolite transporter (DMT)-like permease